jgi:hypothetical protein
VWVGWCRWAYVGVGGRWVDVMDGRVMDGRATCDGMDVRCDGWDGCVMQWMG